MFNRGPRPHDSRHRQRIRESAFLAVTICCVPCICVVGACVLISHGIRKIMAYERPSTKRKREIEREQREIKRRTPWVLEPRLEGALTIGKEDENFGVAFEEMPGLGSKIVMGGEHRDSESEVSSDREEVARVKIERKTDWQVQSLFFKLPLETRRQIYEEAIGGYVFNIFSVEAYRRVSHTRWKTTCAFDCACRRQFKQPGVADEWGNISLLSVLSTCRRIYSESVEILYSKNTFSFDSLIPLTNHLLNIPSHRIPLMRAVQWRYVPLQNSDLRISWNRDRTIVRPDEWSEATPWLDCRKKAKSGEEEVKEVVEGAGCACWECWPEQVWVDNHSHAWLQYCWLMRTLEDKNKVTKSRIDNDFARCFNEGDFDLYTH